MTETAYGVAREFRARENGVVDVSLRFTWSRSMIFEARYAVKRDFARLGFGCHESAGKGVAKDIGANTAVSYDVLDDRRKGCFVIGLLPLFGCVVSRITNSDSGSHRITK